MLKYSFLIFLLHSLLSASLGSQSWGKARNQAGPIVTQITAGEAKSLLEPVILATNDNLVSVQDSTCTNLEFQQTEDFISGAANGSVFYIILREVAIESRVFKVSTCEKTAEIDSVIGLECTALEKSPIVEPGETRSFYIRYQSVSGSGIKFKLLQCPSAEKDQ